MVGTDATPALSRIQIAASFTAEPVAEVLAFWAAELGWRAEVVFAPHAQVFQQLLDPRRGTGTNVLLVRLADLSGPVGPDGARDPERLAAALDDLLTAVRAASRRTGGSLLLVLCPGPATADEADGAALLGAEERIAEELGDVPGAQVVRSTDILRRYPVDDWRDTYAERIGRIPYTREFFAALGTTIARSLQEQFTPRPKVVVVDCDNLLWDGVVAEDGTAGVAVTPARRALQEYLVKQVAAGRLLCLCTRNDEADVRDVLDRHPEMVLRREHVTAIRASWLKKSASLRSLADRLSLGLDTFVFLDDSPVEVAEVRAATPEVLALCLPAEAHAAGSFLWHCWPLDQSRITAEDTSRTRLYQQHWQRLEARCQTPTLANFIAGLDLEVTIRGPEAGELDRVAQLTHRTTQLNLSGIRRTADALDRLDQDRLECRVVDVRDRFGDYGLVGVLCFAEDDMGLTVDTFLLSCRALGRGVEQRMLAHLGAVARERGLMTVTLPYAPTPRNRPALDFLNSLPGLWHADDDGGGRLVVPVDEAAAARYEAADDQAEPSVPVHTAAPNPAAAADPASTRPAPWAQVSRAATELATPAQVLAAMDAQRSGPPSGASVPPPTPVAATVMRLWEVLLGSPVGSVHDNFFELGGNSLTLVQFMSQVRREFGVELSVETLFQSALTAAEIAAAIEEAKRAGTRGDDLDELLSELEEMPEEEVDALLSGD